MIKSIIKKITAAAIVFCATPWLLFAGDASMTKLKNGITLIEKPRPYTETVSVALFIKGGIFLETKDDNGIGNLTSRVWLKSNKILETAEFYGGMVNAKLTPYAFEISFSSPTESASKMYKDFETFLLNPRFDQEVFNREKALLLDELETAKDDPNAVAYDRFTETAFEGSPYAMPTDGKTESIQNLTLRDAEKYYKNNFKGSMIVVAVSGNYGQDFLNDLKNTLNAIDGGKTFEFKCDDALMKKNKRVEDTDPRIQQAKLYIGYNAPAVSSPDYAATKVLSELLGGGMSSRYFTEIRKNLGYAYSVGAAYPSRICSSRFFASAGLDYKNVADAVNKIEEINTGLAETLTDEEILKAKKSILGSALMETQTNAAVAWNAAFFETMGLGADYYDKYVETLKNIDREKLLKAAEIFKGPKTVYVLKPAQIQ